MRLVRNSRDKWKLKEKMDRQCSKDAYLTLENRKEKDSINFSGRLFAHAAIKLSQHKKAN
jgi:hypothetical protein